ncbi:MAG: polymer-forming cytoskeletal protein [Pseudomonadota bacterium]
MLVEKNNVLSGTFTIDGDLAVEGQLSGDVQVRGAVRIRRGGRIDGNVRCRSAIIEGAMAGTLESAEPVSIIEGASLRGRVLAPEVLFDESAGNILAPDRRGEEPAALALAEPGGGKVHKIPLVTGSGGKLIVKPTARLLKDKKDK